MDKVAMTLDATPLPAIKPIREVARVLLQRRELLMEMMKRDLSERYAGQWFGTVWALGHPLIVLLVYVLVFSFIVKSRVTGDTSPAGDYALYLLSGAVPWMTFQESMAKSCTSVTSHAGLVKQVVFPVEILPVASLASPCVAHLIGVTGVTGYALFVHQGMIPALLLLPLLMAMQMVMMLGVGFVLSAISVYFRDVKDFVQIFGLVGIYLTPIFYLPGWMPEGFRWALYANPFSYLVWCYQDVLHTGRIDHPWAWGVLATLTVVLYYFGCRTFRYLKTYFGSVL